jgi:hypothetical protein
MEQFTIVHEAMLGSIALQMFVEIPDPLKVKGALAVLTLRANSPGFEANVEAAVLHFAQMFLVQ